MKNANNNTAPTQRKSIAISDVLRGNSARGFFLKGETMTTEKTLEIMNEDLRTITGNENASFDYDEVQAALAAGDSHLEVPSHLTKTGRPELIPVPEKK